MEALDITTGAHWFDAGFQAFCDSYKKQLLHQQSMAYGTNVAVIQLLYHESTATLVRGYVPKAGF